eukprot:12612-Pelagococcus_subviridis.AAC.5
MYECVLTHRPPTVRQTVNARTNETTVASAGKGREGGRGEGGMRGEGSVSRRNRVAADGERTTRGRVVGDFIFQIDAARGDDASRGRRRTFRRDDDARARRAWTVPMAISREGRVVACARRGRTYAQRPVQESDREIRRVVPPRERLRVHLHHVRSSLLESSRGFFRSVRGSRPSRAEVCGARVGVRRRVRV